MTLSVRLDSALESALERYCEEHGVSKSLVVQESLATFLMDRPTQAGAVQTGKGAASVAVSDNYRAFADAGLIGAVALGGSADKAAVRARVAEVFAQRKARQGGG